MGSFVIAATAFALLLILRKRSKPKILWAVNAALAAIGGAALADTFIGDWIGAVFSAVGGWVGGIAGASATAVIGVVMLALVVMVIFDIAVDRRADTAAIVGLVLLPTLFVVASGPVAGGGSELFAAIREAGGGALGSLIGG